MSGGNRCVILTFGGDEMPARRTKKRSQNDDLDLDMRRSKLALFIQQFEKEAQERLNELENKLENLLSTVDKVFKVELMKMPPSLKNTKIGDLISEVEEIPASNVSIAMKLSLLMFHQDELYQAAASMSELCGLIPKALTAAAVACVAEKQRSHGEALEMQQPLKRMPSKRAKSTDSPPLQFTPATKALTKTSKGGRGTKKSTVESKNTGTLRKGTPVTIKRTESLKTSEHSVTTRPKLRSVVSTGDLHCSMAASSAHISVTTAQGHTVCFSEETKEEINWDLLDDVAWCHIRNLKKLVDHLSSRCQQ